VVTGVTHAVVYRRMGIRLAELILELGVTAIAHGVGAADQDVWGIGPVGVVASGAHPFLEGRMDVLQLRRLLLDVGVAAETHIAGGGG